MRFARLASVLMVLGSVAVGAQEFDFERIRNDFFAGAAGNAAALRRAIDTTERALAEDPKNAQALSVHGFGTVLDGGQAYQKGDALRGTELVQRGLAEMNEAAGLAPSDGLVRVLRGILLQQVSRQMPPAMQAPMLEDARSDFQFLFDAQAGVLDQLGPHRLGELLQALGDIHSRQGRADDAQRYYAMIRQKLPDTEYAKRAVEWMRTRAPLPAERTTCVGCHTGPR
jgi:tetratricopeptide (TPR) repeat protein